HPMVRVEPCPDGEAVAPSEQRGRGALRTARAGRPPKGAGRAPPKGEPDSRRWLGGNACSKLQTSPQMTSLRPDPHAMIRHPPPPPPARTTRPTCTTNSHPRPSAGTHTPPPSAMAGRPRPLYAGALPADDVSPPRSSRHAPTPPPPPEEVSGMSELHDLVDPSAVRLDVAATDWREAIRASGDLLIDTGAID